MAGPRSQRHLQEIYGVDSAGEGPGVTPIPPPTPGPGEATIQKADGTRFDPAIISFPIDVIWDDPQSVAVDVTTDTTALRNVSAATGGADKTGKEMAALLAAQLDLDVELSAKAVGGRVEVLCVAPANTVTLSGLTIT